MKAFEGTKKGNNTKFNLFLTPRTGKAFKVNVWLDGPWDNKTWKGKKIGVIEVPAGSEQTVTRFSVDVSAAVDGLGKKHAIFLVAEGAGEEELFDLQGLGFSSDQKQIAPPVVPQVSISVNGKPIALPSTPLRSTDANGITDYRTYEVVYVLPNEFSRTPRVSASSDNPEVKVDVQQARQGSGKAVVKFDYKGLVKTYNVVFSRAFVVLGE